MYRFSFELEDKEEQTFVRPQVDATIRTQTCQVTILESVHFKKVFLDKKTVGDRADVLFNPSRFRRIRPFIDRVMDEKVSMPRMAFFQVQQTLKKSTTNLINQGSSHDVLCLVDTADPNRVIRTRRLVIPREPLAGKRNYFIWMERKAFVFGFNEEQRQW